MIGGHDPMAMPAPPEIMLILLGLTFVLHISLLGLLFASLWARAGMEWRGGLLYDSLRVHRAGVVGFSLTITLGVPPLLFVQILYGKYFYASSISIGFPWLAVIGYLLIGFYALYWAQWSWMRHDCPSLWGKLSLVLSAACVLAVGFTYSWNHLKSMSEAPWNNSVSHAAAMHRLVGYFGAATLASGVWGAWFGPHWRRDKRIPTGAWIAAMGGGIGVLTWAFTSRFAASGAWGADRVFMLLGGSLALVAAIAALAVERLNFSRWLTTLASPLVTVGIFLQRESFRLETMRPFYDPFAAAQRTQWSTIVMFILALLVGLLVLIWLLRQVRRARMTSLPHV